jgi:hypothetical protein
MALIARFEQRPLEPRKIHDEVLCGYNAVQIGERRILQLETYGSADRQVPGKTSQSIQLNEDGARSLINILRSAFPGLD